jgi:hypothetical protein
MMNGQDSLLKTGNLFFLVYTQGRVETDIYIYLTGRITTMAKKAKAKTKVAAKRKKKATKKAGGKKRRSKKKAGGKKRRAKKKGGKKRRRKAAMMPM